MGFASKVIRNIKRGNLLSLEVELLTIIPSQISISRLAHSVKRAGKNRRHRLLWLIHIIQILLHAEDCDDDNTRTVLIRVRNCDQVIKKLYDVADISWHLPPRGVSEQIWNSMIVPFFRDSLLWMVVSNRPDRDHFLSFVEHVCDTYNGNARWMVQKCLIRSLSS